MKRKGMNMQPVNFIEMAATALLLLSITWGILNMTGPFVKQETVGVQADRVLNGALALDSAPEGSLSFDLEPYSFKVDNGYIYVKYQEQVENRSLSMVENSYSSFQGPSSFQRVENQLIIEKNFENGDESLVFTVE